MRRSKVEKDVALRAKPKRFRVTGGGRKVGNESIEDVLYQWIVGRRTENKHVTRSLIQGQAKIIHQDSGSNKPFMASNGWCDNFMKRYKLSIRQKTHQSQKLPDELIPKVIEFFRYVRHYYAKNNILPDQTVAMDETCVHLENVSNKTVSILLVSILSISLKSSKL